MTASSLTYNYNHGFMHSPITYYVQWRIQGGPGGMPPRTTQTQTGHNADYRNSLLILFWYSRNISFRVFRKAILSAEIAENHFWGSPRTPLGELTALPIPYNPLAGGGNSLPPENSSRPWPSRSATDYVFRHMTLQCFDMYFLHVYVSFTICVGA